MKPVRPALCCALSVPGDGSRALPENVEPGGGQPHAGPGGAPDLESVLHAIDAAIAELITIRADTEQLGSAVRRSEEIVVEQERALDVELERGRQTAEMIGELRDRVERREATVATLREKVDELEAALRAWESDTP